MHKYYHPFKSAESCICPLLSLCQRLSVAGRATRAATLKNVSHNRHNWTLFCIINWRVETTCFTQRHFCFWCHKISPVGGAVPKMWNASRFCVSSLRRGHANLLCIVPILVYVLPKLYNDSAKNSHINIQYQVSYLIIRLMYPHINY